MKKLIAISVVFALIAGAAFAQTANGISVNAWGRGAFSPLVNVGAPKVDGKTPSGAESATYSGASTSWGWNGNWIRTDFRVNGNADFVGFQVQVSETSEGGIGVCDNAFIWAKPFSNDILKLSVGHFYEDTLRGKVDTDTGFENFVAGDLSADTIFSRFQASHTDGIFVNSNGPSGYMLSSAPVDGLFIGLLVNGKLFGSTSESGTVGGSDVDWDGTYLGPGATRVADAFRFMQFGFGYNIADIGHIRAQWLGGWFGSKVGDEEVGKAMAKGKYIVGPSLGTTGRIEAAFALTAIQNLMVDLGFKIWLPLSAAEGDAKATNGVDIGLGARFRADAFQIVGHIVSNFASYSHIDGKDESNNGIGLAVNLLPSYDLDAFTIGGSIGMRVNTVGKGYDGKKPEGDAGKGTMKVGFGAYAKKGLGSGSVQAGVAYSLAPSTGGKANGSNVFSIPIILEYAFF